MLYDIWAIMFDLVLYVITGVNWSANIARSTDRWASQTKRPICYEYRWRDPSSFPRLSEDSVRRMAMAWRCDCVSKIERTICCNWWSWNVSSWTLGLCPYENSCIFDHIVTLTTKTYPVMDTTCYRNTHNISRNYAISFSVRFAYKIQQWSDEHT